VKNSARGACAARARRVRGGRDAKAQEVVMRSARAFYALVMLISLIAVTRWAERPESASGDRYDAEVLKDRPVAYWATGGSGADKSGGGHSGSFAGGAPAVAGMPNGNTASRYDGSSEYMIVPSSPEFSIQTRRMLTWEAWIRPDGLQHPRSVNSYVDFLGKCSSYSPSCEWEGRMYNARGVPGRASRISAYAFNPGAGLGSGADWQPAADVLQPGQWLHVVAQYQTRTTPSGCLRAYPGTIEVWVNGVAWNSSKHNPTGCMSQYAVRPRAGDSPVTVGTLAGDSWFRGSIGKVAIYDHLLSAASIKAHYSAMTGRAPTGTCAVTCTLTGAAR
jgi:hypothetical protein